MKYAECQSAVDIMREVLDLVRWDRSRRDDSDVAYYFRGERKAHLETTFDESLYPGLEHHSKMIRDKYRKNANSEIVDLTLICPWASGDVQWSETRED